MFTLVEAARQLAAEGSLPVNVRFAFDGEEEVGGDSIVQWLEQDERSCGCGADPRRLHGHARPAHLLRRRSRDALFPPPRPHGQHRHALGHVRLGGAQRDACAHERALEGRRGAGRVRSPRRFAPGGRRRRRRSSRPGRSFRAARSSSSTTARVPIGPGAADDFYLRTFADTSLDVNGIASGSPDLVKTVLPVEARANVSIRLAPGQDPDEIREAFERLVREGLPEGAELDITVKNSARPALTPPDAEAIRLAGDAFEEVLGTRPLLVRTGGTLPIYAALVDRGLPTLATGFGVEGECNVHAPNENVPEDAIDLGVADDARTSSRGSERLTARAPFTSPLAEELADDVLERFLRYVQVDTQGAYRVARRPSTEKQLDLSRMLVDELRELGLADAAPERGRVGLRRPARDDGAPVVGLIAHVDTTPDVLGAGVAPIVHRAWGGGADRPARRLAAVARSRAAAGARGAGRPRHRHERRDDSARRRRQGGYRRDHGRRRVPREDSGPAAGADPGGVHRRRGGRPWRRGLRPRGVRRGRRVHARRLRPRRGRDRDVLRDARCA